MENLLGRLVAADPHAVTLGFVLFQWTETSLPYTKLCTKNTSCTRCMCVAL